MSSRPPSKSRDAPKKTHPSLDKCYKIPNRKDSVPATATATATSTATIRPPINQNRLHPNSSSSRSQSNTATPSTSSQNLQRTQPEDRSIQLRVQLPKVDKHTPTSFLPPTMEVPSKYTMKNSSSTTSSQQPQNEKQQQQTSQSKTNPSSSEFYPVNFKKGPRERIAIVSSFTNMPGEASPGTTAIAMASTSPNASGIGVKTSKPAKLGAKRPSTQDQSPFTSPTSDSTSGPSNSNTNGSLDPAKKPRWSTAAALRAAVANQIVAPPRTSVSSSQRKTSTENGAGGQSQPPPTAPEGSHNADTINPADLRTPDQSRWNNQSNMSPRELCVMNSIPSTSTWTSPAFTSQQEHQPQQSSTANNFQVQNSNANHHHKSSQRSDDNQAHSREYTNSINSRSGHQVKSGRSQSNISRLPSSQSTRSFQPEKRPDDRRKQNSKNPSSGSHPQPKNNVESQQHQPNSPTLALTTTQQRLQAMSQRTMGAQEDNIATTSRNLMNRIQETQNDPPPVIREHHKSNSNPPLQRRHHDSTSTFKSSTRTSSRLETTSSNHLQKSKKEQSHHRNASGSNRQSNFCSNSPIILDSDQNSAAIGSNRNTESGRSQVPSGRHNNSTHSTPKCTTYVDDGEIPSTSRNMTKASLTQHQPTAAGCSRMEITVPSSNFQSLSEQQTVAAKNNDNLNVVSMEVDTDLKISHNESSENSVAENRLGLLDFMSSGKELKIKCSTSNNSFVKSEEVTPMAPKKAHYNSHQKEDQMKYVDQVPKELKDPIRIHTQVQNQHLQNRTCTSTSTSRDTKDKVAFLDRRRNVYSKYDFEKRKFDNSHLATYHQRHDIIRKIEGNRVVVIDGFTGCGKTTQVPQLILDRAFDKNKPCNIIVTQPRKVAATSVAKRICQERDWDVGTVVGYQVGLDKKCNEDTLITFVTTEVLLRKIITTKTLTDWTHIIIDEVHERDTQTDLLLLFIRIILQQDKTMVEQNVKIILMSATLDPKQFCDYFKMIDRSNRDRDVEINTQVVRIPPAQQRHKVQVIYLDELTQNLDGKFVQDKACCIDELYAIAVNIIMDLDDDEQRQGEDPRRRHVTRNRALVKNRGSVLVFLPGIQEIKKLENNLIQANLKYSQDKRSDDEFKWNIIKLHSSTKDEEQKQVFEDPQPFYRKIILSTNIAESSITVPDVVYVIDFCLTKNNRIDPDTNYTSLKTTWCAVNQSIQRKGRTGRVGPGKFYVLVPLAFYKKLAPKPEPEIKRTSIEKVVLQVKEFNKGSPKSILACALAAPQISSIERAVVNLKQLGALTLNVTLDSGQHKKVQYDTCDGDLTNLGRIMALLPMSPQCSRLIALGHCFGVLDECIIIAAGLTAKYPFVFNKELDSYMKKLRFSENSFSDCLTLLNAFKEWERREGLQLTIEARKNWGRTHYIQTSNMMEIRYLVQDVKDRLKRSKLFVESQNVDGNSVGDELSNLTKFMIKMSIAGAFYPNYFHYTPNKTGSKYEQECLREVGGLDLVNTVYFTNYPTQGPAQLYKDQVANYLTMSSLSGPIVPYITFDNPERNGKHFKVYATFDEGSNSGRKMGGIYEAVYRALKRREINDFLEIKRFRHRDDERDQFERAKRFQLEQNFIKCPRTIRLPSITEEHLRVVITYVESPSQFWMIPYSLLEKFQDMRENCNKNVVHLPYPPSKLVPGALCLSPLEENEDSMMVLYRAKIQWVFHDKALVYFVDHGKSSWIPTLKLRKLTPQMIELNKLHSQPCLAFECRLSNLRPSVSRGPTWDQKAIDKFKEITGNYEPFDFKIFAIANGIIIGELIKVTSQTAGEERLNVNEYLKTEKLADDRIEPNSAMMNHNDRNNYKRGVYSADEEWIKACDCQQKGEEKTKDFFKYRPPREVKDMDTVKLKGPISPLELKFKALCQSSASKSVYIDQQSVNCIVLEHEPLAPTSRLLIAASINIRENSGDVSPRNTTLMPNFPGLEALISLMFCPKAELRTNGNPGFTYTGALCGLGNVPNTNTSIYQDQDMEIVFNTRIDDEDINNINVIRRYLNDLLRVDEVGEMKKHLQKHLRNILKELLVKKREPVDAYYQKNNWTWGQIDSSHLKQLPKDFEVQSLDIFLPHSMIQLNEGPQFHDDLDWIIP